MNPTNKHGHYYKDVSTLQVIDVYRVLQLFNVSDPCIQHAVKKLLVAGGRGAGKDITKDISEAIDSLERWEEMDKENKIPLPMTLTVTNSTLPLAPKQPVPPPPPVTDYRKLFEGKSQLFESACDRLFDVLCGDDGQAYKGAERFFGEGQPAHVGTSTRLSLQQQKELM